jgi:hypothetical protein
MSHPTPVELSIDHLSSYEYEFLCIFTVTADGVSTLYHRYLTSKQAGQPPATLNKYLLEHLRKATVIKSWRPGPREAK